MRALRVFGSFVYMTAVIFFCLCISAGPLCTFTINNMIVGRAVSSRVLDEVYRVWPEVTYGQMEAIEKEDYGQRCAAKADRRSPGCHG